MALAMDVPRGFIKGHIGNYVRGRELTIAKKIRARIKEISRPIGIAMDSEGSVYAIGHKTQGFQYLLRHQRELVVGVYNHLSSPEDIADDIQAHAHELGL